MPPGRMGEFSKDRGWRRWPDSMYINLGGRQAAFCLPCGYLSGQRLLRGHVAHRLLAS